MLASNNSKPVSSSKLNLTKSDKTQTIELTNACTKFIEKYYLTNYICDTFCYNRFIVGFQDYSIV